MIEVLNTPFELSIRVILILQAAMDRYMTEDMLTAADFIAVHGKEFGILDVNLHGDNLFKFSEFTVKRDMVKIAVKSLVLDGFLLVNYTDSGFAYALSQKGTEYCNKIDCDYANEYRVNLTKTVHYLENKNEQTILNIINKLSIKSLQN